MKKCQSGVTVAISNPEALSLASSIPKYTDFFTVRSVPDELLFYYSHVRELGKLASQGPLLRRWSSVYPSKTGEDPREKAAALRKQRGQPARAASAGVLAVSQVQTTAIWSGAGAPGF